MGRSIGTAPSQSLVTQQVPIGGIAAVLRSGDAYKAIGESVSRAAYPALSAAFPRNGSFYSEQVTQAPPVTVRAMAYGNGVLVMLGYSSAATTNYLYSRDRGKTWRTGTLPSGRWSAVIFANGKFVAVGVTGGVTGPGAITSTDGLNWTAAGNLSTSIDWAGIAWSDTLLLYVAVGAAGGGGGTTVAASSPDGVTWTPRTMPTSSVWSAVVWGGGKFVAVSQGTAAATSVDGITWVARSIASGSYLDVAYGNGVFVAAGSQGSPALATSPDGISWTVRTGPPGINGGLTGVMFGDGVFLGSTNVQGLCCASYDGLTWIEKTVAATANTVAIGAFAAGAFVVPNNSTTSGGTYGFIAYAEDMSTSDYLYLAGTAGQFIRVK